ncbi:AMP-dependent synthetase [Mesorhizobium sp. M4B.F.Ca.ET.169.01.1.1]|uniref:acyl--CoA ligase n=1 Tax=unclassified Mesorhizobium TaxID=325217 RepID=UPI000FCC1969|nr:MULTISPECIES: acyl--CoA ligase [unclassified Mesorhizobium]RVD46296.1 AMP-dependent synthetase [Mesorhizobium sp. M4B.F.Ca.ET.019.03.1.1]TGT37753.1 AMP-dependent synthetase [Mesorhizobium sp. M4B.F.Ca.ET.169.01.1.1]TIU72149.1 MAG: AMP-dependent synthetase [Mesorhizobium sp.]TIW14088.1 MAG: AMP-dependent synthetase [Mesorhizobium sp.]
MNTIRDILSSATSGGQAIGAPARSDVAFGELLALVDRTVLSLNNLGVGRGDKLAIVLDNGPEMVAAFLACATACTTAPLNPAYREEEFFFYLDDLKAKALLVAAGSDSPALAAAARVGIPIIHLHARTEGPAGLFDLSGTSSAAATPGLADSEDVALVLHTSGTTSRPKIVPLSHTNLLTSAANIVRTLKLGPSDRCLNIMPLFHIHGLVAAVLASLSAGASVFCTPGFNALKFFGWMSEARPTWYTAVPTMHQAILARSSGNAETIGANPLRFIRSSSASLPAPVFAEMERVFGCPVIEAYSMTENAHQMTSNQLPPGQRKPGSVGLAAGPEVAIMSEDGRLLPLGQVGEIVTRGANVTRGYENNPKANSEAFTNGWFRTGDQGVMDDDGFLRLTGRLKEIINRGGEKIAPLEVDEVLMAHPAVHQAVTFAIPHNKLGEDVAAVIVLREGAQAGERDIREFAAGRLADFKVPRRVVFVPEIPKGATGKMQRIGLAAKLGLA